MKRHLPLIAGALAISLNALAQPTLTASGCNPVVGDQFVNAASPYAAPGSGGVNQTWNFSSWTTSTTSTLSVVAISSTTYSASFSNSNLATTGNGTSFEYFNANSGAYQSFGSGNTSSIDSYTDGEDRLRYPFTYNSTYNDVFASTFTSGGNTIDRSGSNTVTADGYGTLTTPAGTFSNVLRIHYQMTYKDSTHGSGSVLTSTRDQYLWYLNGNHTAIATISSFTIVPSAGSPITNQSAGYLSNATTGVSAVAAGVTSVSLFPNPAASFVHVGLSLEKGQEASVTVLNSLGAVAIPAITCRSPRGASEVKLDVSVLPEGVYFAQVQLDGTLAATRKFVISR